MGNGDITMNFKLEKEDYELLMLLGQVLDVSDPARPEGLRHVVIRFVVNLLLRVKWL
jgi:hypothetical protein